MAAIFADEFRLRFHWSLPLKLQLTVFEHNCIGSDNDLAPTRRQAILGTNDD